MSQPNVVFVLTDDQGYGDLSCLGNPVLRTPCIDRFHDESVRFTDFHVAPMCTPTRGELLTGRDALYNLPLAQRLTRIQFACTVVIGLPRGELRGTTLTTTIVIGTKSSSITTGAHLCGQPRGHPRVCHG